MTLERSQAILYFSPLFDNPLLRPNVPPSAFQRVNSILTLVRVIQGNPSEARGRPQRPQQPYIHPVGCSLGRISARSHPHSHHSPDLVPVNHPTMNVSPAETSSRMGGQLPWHVRDHQLEAQFPEGTDHIVVHAFEDPDAPPTSPLRSERWESDRHPVGSGGQGQVFIQRLQHAGITSRPLRPVKFIPLGDGTGRKIYRYRRELETNFRFSHRRVSRTKCSLSFSTSVRVNCCANGYSTRSTS